MNDFRIGNGYDVHALADGIPMYLGGVRIEHGRGFVAHSDGDLLIHALCDALLGALGLGDIGQHFPDTAVEYNGIDSKFLLARCVALIEERGYGVGSVDCTVLAQEPKLRPYIDRMREVLAELLHVGVDRVSVKATTTERLGFVGRQEGVAVLATALVYK